jgi:hypothetical protein
LSFVVEDIEQEKLTAEANHRQCKNDRVGHPLSVLRLGERGAADVACDDPASVRKEEDT